MPTLRYPYLRNRASALVMVPVQLCANHTFVTVPLQGGKGLEAGPDAGVMLP